MTEYSEGEAIPERVNELYNRITIAIMKEFEGEHIKTGDMLTAVGIYFGIQIGANIKDFDQNQAEVAHLIADTVAFGVTTAREHEQAKSSWL